jgi:hypothetical protein
MKRSLLACLALLALVSAAAAKPPQTEEERTAALQTLRWRDGETLTLPMSQATLKAPEPVRQLAGSDAVTLWEALNGLEAPPSTEAALYDPASQALVFYQKLGDGYVKLDDWSDVDADAMLKSVTENTEADNVRRKAAGLAALHVVGWLERPHLDQHRALVLRGARRGERIAGQQHRPHAGARRLREAGLGGPEDRQRHARAAEGRPGELRLPDRPALRRLPAGRQGGRVRHRRTCGRRAGRQEP